MSQMPTVITRKARLWPVLPDTVVTLPSPPVAPTPSSRLTLFTTIIGLLGGAVFGLMYAVTGSGSGIIMLAFMGVSLLTGIGSLVTYIVQSREVKRNLAHLTEAYEASIREKEQQLSDLKQQEYEARMQIDPPPPMRQAFDDRTLYLWARRPDDPDFLSVRLGMGYQPTTFTIRGEERNSITLPTVFASLDQRMRHLKTEYATVLAPLTVNPGEQGPVAIVGRAIPQGVEQARDVVQTMLAHLAYHHSPEDVHMIVLAPASQHKRWAWATQLPHTLAYSRQAETNEVESRRVAIGPDAIMSQLPLISRELSRRELLLGDERRLSNAALPLLPRLVIVVDHFDAEHGDLETLVLRSVMDFSQTKHVTSNRPLLTVSPLRRAEMAMALSQGKQLGVTVLCVCMNKADIPPTCGLMIDLDTTAPTAITRPLTRNGVTDTSSMQKQPQAIIRVLQPNPPPAVACETVDMASIDELTRFAAHMRQLRPAYAKRPQIRQQVDVRLLFEPPLDPLMYTPAELWRESSYRTPGPLLRVPIGQKIGDELQYLDLLKDGPHGLLIGQTGSGKSELLQTLITMLALTYAPQEINFLLIDYKAGLALEPFRRLPHTIGFLSNVSSAAQIQRFIIMLRAEALRRQMLEKARKPMPRLLIIIDEFAQMVKQTESVLDEIFTITRVGREIGMHLLLAAQRPEGVIGSKVRDYVQYRLCLRVSSAEDSREVLGRVDAASLPASIPGRGYLLHGDNQLDLFQAARATLPIESSTTQTQRANTGRSQKLTVADLIIERSRTCYSHEQMVKHDLYYWPDPLPAPGTLVPDPLTLFAVETNTGATTPGAEELVVQSSLLTVTPQTILSLRDKNALLKEVLRQRNDGGETPLSFPLGLADLPAEQKCLPFCVDLHGSAGTLSGGPLLIAGSAGSGKATALQTMLFWLVTRYTPRLLRCMVIDPDHDLEMFQHLPHMYNADGTALWTNGEDDNVLLQWLNHMTTLLSERRQHYGKQRWDEQTLTHLRAQGEQLPAFLLVVSNYQTFAERYMVNGPLKDLVLKVADARSLGAYAVLSSADVSGRGFPYELIARMGTRIGLFFSDDQQRYTLFGRQTTQTESVPGRGLVLLRDRSLYEVQLALPVAGSSEKIRSEVLKRELERLMQ